MKRIIFTILYVTIVVISLHAQTALSLNMINGQKYQTLLSSIDSLYFNDEHTEMFVERAGVVSSIPVAEIIRMAYEPAAATVEITYNGNDVSIINPFYFDGIRISHDGAKVTATNETEFEAEYTLAGESNDGYFKIYSTKKFQITMKGLNLTNPNGPVINSQSKKKGEIKSQKGYVNILTDGTTYTTAPDGEDQKGCIFSEGQLVFKGAGELQVYAKHGNGIVSDDWISVENSTISINTTANAAKALKANEFIYISGGVLNITQSGNRVYENGDYSYCSAIKADEGDENGKAIIISGGEISINSSAEGGRGISSDLPIDIIAGKQTIAMSGKGGKAIKSDKEITIGAEGSEGPALTAGTTGSYISSSSGSPKAIKAMGKITVLSGDLNITTTKNKGEGIESKTSCEFRGGKIYLKCYDDCVNSAGQILFNGANVYAWSTGNDAIDSNKNAAGSITIQDGAVFVFTTAGGPEMGFDNDNSSNIRIYGGICITAGGNQGGGGGGGRPGGGWGGSSSGSSVTISGATQGYAFVSSSLSYSSGRYYTLQDASGNNIVTYTFPQSLTSSMALFTAPSMTKGSTYYVKYSTTEPTDATVNVGGLYVGSSATGTTQVTSFTAQ